MRHPSGNEVHQHAPLGSDANDPLRPMRGTSVHRQDHPGGGPHRGQGRAQGLHPLSDHVRVGPCGFLSPQLNPRALEGAPQHLEVALSEHALVRDDDLGHERLDVVVCGDDGQTRHGRASLSQWRDQRPSPQFADGHVWRRRLQPRRWRRGQAQARLVHVQVDKATACRAQVSQEVDPSPGSRRLVGSGHRFFWPRFRAHQAGSPQENTLLGGPIFAPVSWASFRGQKSGRPTTFLTRLGGPPRRP
jgi:hypothetical protein